MSTRSRILLALLALTLAPLLGVAVWACVQAVRWSPDALQMRLARAAIEGAVAVRAARAEAGAELEDLGRRIVAAGEVDSATIESVLADWPAAAGFTSLRITRDGVARFARAIDPESTVGCAAADAPAVEAEFGAVRVSGVPRPERLLDRGGASADAPRLAVLSGDGGAPVADPWCLSAAGLLPPGAHALQSPRAFAVPLAGEGLAVVGLPGASWPAPFPEAGFWLLVAAVFLALAAAGAFVILVRELWRSMDVLTTAADRIGQGDFSPWLPPPSRDEVGRLSYAIGTMAARLEQVMQQNARNRQMAAIGELASHVSHEIRNPLSSIKLNLQSIDREMRDGTVPADLPAVVRLCLREVNRLDGTVQGVLRLAGTGDPMFAPCGLHAVVRDALETMTPQVEARGTRVELRLEASSDAVRADAVQLRSVVLNLLLNAHDAMTDGAGRLEIRSEAVEDGARGRLLRVRFADSGPGIPPEDRERIFQPFFTTKPTGTGIGLPLAVRVVEAHGGRLYLEHRSELQAGAEFVLELPLRAAAEAGISDDSAPVWRPRRKGARQRTPEAVG